MAGGLARGEVRLYRFPRPDKERPVVILTRGSAIGYLSKVTVAPITSTIRGTPSEVILGEADGMKGPCAINLHNLVTVSQAHLGRRVAVLSAERSQEILRWALRSDALVEGCHSLEKGPLKRQDRPRTDRLKSSAGKGAEAGGLAPTGPSPSSIQVWRGVCSLAGLCRHGFHASRLRPCCSDCR